MLVSGCLLFKRPFSKVAIEVAIGSTVSNGPLSYLTQETTVAYGTANRCRLVCRMLPRI